ncbi:unnamed protein product [Coregonus sp. 'balchen']|nr:unnamed protein product [Coregonus sp. 'balchen']
MKLTYTYQCHMMNTCRPPSISDLQEQWPFLFTKLWLCDHFNTLTGIQIDSRLTQALLNKGKRIVKFFKSQKTKWRREIQCLLNGIGGNIRCNDDLTFTAAILLLMTHFKEKDESLFLLADGRVVCGLDSESNFTAALSVLFSTFYVVNIEYQESASATLELIKMFLVRINPERTKCTAKAGVSRNTGKVVQRKPLPINPRYTLSH